MPNVLFLCGSPRRGRSTSLLTAKYLARFLDHDHSFLDVARAKLTADPAEADAGFLRVVEAMRRADAIVWTFGVWSWFVPTALHRLLDKLFTQGVEPFDGRLAAAVMSSGGVGDDHAGQRLRFAAEQLGLAWVGDVSAEGSPFMGYIGDGEATEHSCRVLADRLNRALADGYAPTRMHEPVDWRLLSSAHPGDGFPVEGVGPDADDDGRRLLVVVGDTLEADPAAGATVASIRRFSRHPVDVVELVRRRIKPCAGCYLCGTRPEGVCVIDDDYAEVRELLDAAAGVVYLATSSAGLIDERLKRFLDRSWDLAHRPRLQERYGFVVASGGGDQDAPAARILENILSKTGVRVIGALARNRADGGAFAATVRRTVEELDRAIDERWRIADRFQVRASGWAFRDLAASTGMIMRADYAWHRQQRLFDAPSPGGWNAVLRLLFSNKKLEKKMLEKARAGRDEARAARLQQLLDEGGQLGTGEEVELA